MPSNGEGEPQKVVAGRAGCLQSAESKHIQGKLSGREKSGREKGSASTRDDRSPGRTVNQSKFKKKLSVKSHLTKTCPGNGLQVLHSSCQTSPEPGTATEVSFRD